MKKIIYIFISLCAGLAQANAQDRSHFYTNLLNPFLANPSLAGSETNIYTVFNARTMVGGIEGAPRTINFGIHAPVSNGTGIGGKIVSDWRGAFQTVNAEGAYSKQIRLNKDHSITFGLSLGVVQTSFKTEMLNGNVDLSDQALSSKDLNRVRIASGAGATYRFNKKAEVHATFPMLITGDESLNGFMVGGGSYTFNFEKNDKYTLKPVVNYYNFVHSAKMFDLLLEGGWNNTITLQAGYRSNGSAIMGAGFMFKSLAVNYIYYYHTGGLSDLAPAQNEIALSFYFNKPEKKVVTKDKTLANEEELQDRIAEMNEKVNNLMKIEKSNPGLVNIKKEMNKLNKELGKILSTYRIENKDQIRQLQELQSNIDLLITQYND